MKNFSRIRWMRASCDCRIVLHPVLLGQWYRALWQPSSTTRFSLFCPDRSSVLPLLLKQTERRRTKTLGNAYPFGRVFPRYSVRSSRVSVNSDGRNKTKQTKQTQEEKRKNLSCVSEFPIVLVLFSLLMSARIVVLHFVERLPLARFLFRRLWC